MTHAGYRTTLTVNGRTVPCSVGRVLHHPTETVMPRKYQRKPYVVEALQIEHCERGDPMPIHGLKKGEHSGGACNGVAVLNFPVIRPLFEGDWAIIDPSGRKFAMTDEAFRAIYEPIAEPEPEPPPEPARPPRDDWDAALQWNGPEDNEKMKAFCGNRFNRVFPLSESPERAFVETSQFFVTYVNPGNWVVQTGDRLSVVTSAQFLDQYLTRPGAAAIAKMSEAEKEREFWRRADAAADKANKSISKTCGSLKPDPVPIPVEPAIHDEANDYDDLHTVADIDKIIGTLRNVMVENRFRYTIDRELVQVPSRYGKTLRLEPGPHASMTINIDYCPFPPDRAAK